MKRRRTPLRALVAGRAQRTLLGQMLHSREIEQTLKAALYTQKHSLWRGLIATPPASLLETIVTEFFRKTAIPLEIPFMFAVSLVAQYLAEKGVRIALGKHQSIKLDLYTVVLAPSGRCKTFVCRAIQEAAEAAGWAPRTMDEPQSSAAFFEVLAEAEGQPLFWRIDEWGEFWNSLKAEHHAMSKRYMLMAYDYAPITYRVKSKRRDENGQSLPEKAEVKDACLSIFGTSVLANVSKQLTPEDWQSGLVQRFGFLVGKDDPSRRWYDKKYAFLDAVDVPTLTTAWNRALQTPVCPRYELTGAAREVIAETFFLLGRDSGLGEDFIRRVEYRVFKYGCVFHWLLGKTNPLIDEEDVGWGARLASLHVEDLRYLLDATEYNEYFNLYTRAVRLQERLGADFSARKIRMYLRRDVKSMDEAQAMYKLVLDRPPNVAGSQEP